MISTHEINMLNKRDDRVLKILYTEFFPWLRKICLTVLQNTQAAEDAAQETMIKLWTNSHKRFKNEQNIKDFLFIVARNNCINEHKRARHRAKVHQLPHYNDFDAPFNQEAEILLEVYKAIHRLTPKEEKAIQFFYRDGLTAREIAEILQVSLRTVYRLLETALKKLQKLTKNKWVIITVILMFLNICAVLPPKKTIKILAIFIHQIVFTKGRSKTK